METRREHWVGRTRPVHRLTPLFLPLLIVGTLLVAASPGEAHAELLSTQPEPNARVDDPPTTFVFHFSEELEPRYTEIRVVDEDGQDRVQAVDVEPDQRRRVDVEVGQLDTGIYTVRWEVLSAVDGHPTSDVYLVAVNMDIPEGTELPEGEEVADIRIGETLARAVAYAGASLVAGMPAYLLYRFRFVPVKGWTHRPITDRARRDAFLMRIAAWGALASAAAVITLIIALAVRIESDPWNAVITTTNGGALAFRAAFLIAAAVVALQGARITRRLPWTAATLALALGALLITSNTSHAASTDAGVKALNVAVDFLHHAAAAAWISGVVALLLTLPRAPDARTAGILVRDFSPYAVGAVILLVATGIYASLLHLQDPFSLSSPSTGWEWALLAKIVLVLPLIALGAWNRYSLQPRLLSGDEQPGLRRIKGSVRLEVLLMAIVLVATGAITHATPPGQEGDGPASPLPGLVDEHETVDGDLFLVTINPQPVTVGIQNVTVHMEAAGEVPENASLFITIHSPEGDETGPLRLQRIADEPRWFVRDTLFTQEGGWHAIVLVQGRDYYEQFDFVIDVE